MIMPDGASPPLEPTLPTSDVLEPRHAALLAELDAIDPHLGGLFRRAERRRFKTFREEFHAERTHESLGMQPPATRYHASPRPYRGPVEPLEYPGHFELRQVGATAASAGGRPG
jgi:hypothetical protein